MTFHITLHYSNWDVQNKFEEKIFQIYFSVFSIPLYQTF